MKNLKRRAIALIAVAVALSTTTACSTIKTEPHYLGFKERITQGEKQLFAGSQLTVDEQVQTKARLSGGKDSKQIMSSAILMDGYKRAIIRRELLAGSLEANWGREIDLVFSIQLCNQIVSSSQTSFIGCADQPASPPISVRKRITLIGSREVTVQFPENVVWTYQVLDQSSPVVWE
jgi:hypothetical protein